MTNHLTSARAAILETLRTSKFPLTAQAVADYSGVSLETCRQLLSRMVEREQVHNVGTNRSGMYLIGKAPKPELPQRRYVSAEPYVPKAIPTRPGSMDAYSLPSLQNGELVERKRPMLIGGRV